MKHDLHFSQSDGFIEGRLRCTSQEKNKQGALGVQGKKSSYLIVGDQWQRGFGVNLQRGEEFC